MQRFNDFEGLSLFVRVVRAGGLAAAERATGLPKATLSRRIAALEQTMQTTLLRRTGKGVSPTEAGQALYDRIASAFSVVEEAVGDTLGETRALSGALRISLPPDLGAGLLAPVLIRFQATHPGVLLDINIADRRVSLVEEGYDLVVRMGPLEESSLVQKSLGKLSRTLVASAAFLERAGRLDDIDDLKRHPGLFLRRDLADWVLSSPDGKSITVRLRDGFFANRQTLLVEAALAGLGIGNLPVFLVEKGLREGLLVRVLERYRPEPVEVSALWVRGTVPSRLVRAVLVDIEQALRQAH